jgi:hypothetical protein
MQKTLQEELQELLHPSIPSTEYQGIPSGDNFQAVKAVLDIVINKLKDLESQGPFKSITVYDLDESHPLKQPIHAVLQESGDIVLASWPELHLYGEGETPNDAIAALKVEIIDLFTDLSSTSPSELGILPQRWLKTLKQVIRQDA